MTRAMTMIQPVVARVLETVRGVPARLGLPAVVIPVEVAYTAAAGALLLGLAGAALGFDGGVNPFPVDKTAAGVSVKLYWGYAWVGYLALGLLAGAVFGGGVAYAGRLVNPRRGPLLALLFVGAVAGVSAGATWGKAVARERQFEVRAQQPFAKSVPLPRGAEFSVVNGPVRLHGSVVRTMNYPLLAFMMLAGAVGGVLAARGLVEFDLLARLGYGGGEGEDVDAAAAPAEAQRNSRRAA